MGVATQMGTTTSNVTSVVGTQAYMSPEILNNQEYDLKTDIW